MSSNTAAANREATSRRGMLWTGRIISALPVLMLLMSSIMKFARPPQVMEQFVGKFGYPESTIFPIAVLELSCAVLYVIPRTRVLGALLLTGYLGGAIATHVRVADPGFLIPFGLGVCIWAGVWLRDERLRALLPLRKPSGGS
ncbi:MAG: DoxX family protein [Terriglobales bacterium]